jgi:hypothetical protein
MSSEYKEQNMQYGETKLGSWTTVDCREIQINQDIDKKTEFHFSSRKVASFMALSEGSAALFSGKLYLA